MVRASDQKHGKGCILVTQLVSDHTCPWPGVLLTSPSLRKRRQVTGADFMVESVDVSVYPLSPGVWERCISLSGILTAVPLSKIMWKLDLSAPKNMGPLEKLSRV